MDALDCLSLPFENPRTTSAALILGGGGLIAVGIFFSTAPLVAAAGTGALVGFGAVSIIIGSLFACSSCGPSPACCDALYCTAISAACFCPPHS